MAMGSSEEEGLHQRACCRSVSLEEPSTQQHGTVHSLIFRFYRMLRTATGYSSTTNLCHIIFGVDKSNTMYSSLNVNVCLSFINLKLRGMRIVNDIIMTSS